MSGADTEEARDVVARTVKGFCKAYGIGHTKAYELIADGKIETRKVGTRTLIVEESAQQWLRSLPNKPSFQPSAETRIAANGSEPRRKRQYHKSRKHRDLRTMANNHG